MLGFWALCLRLRPSVFLNIFLYRPPLRARRAFVASLSTLYPLSPSWVDIIQAEYRYSRGAPCGCDYAVAY